MKNLFTTFCLALVLMLAPGSGYAASGFSVIKGSCAASPEIGVAAQEEATVLYNAGALTPAYCGSNFFYTDGSHPAGYYAAVNAAHQFTGAYLTDSTTFNSLQAIAFRGSTLTQTGSGLVQVWDVNPNGGDPVVTDLTSYAPCVFGNTSSGYIYQCSVATTQTGTMPVFTLGEYTVSSNVIIFQPSVSGGGVSLVPYQTVLIYEGSHTSWLDGQVLTIISWDGTYLTMAVDHADETGMLSGQGTAQIGVTIPAGHFLITTITLETGDQVLNLQTFFN